MLALIVLVYLALAVRVRLVAQIAFVGESGSICILAGAAGIILRYDGEILREKGGLRLTLTRRYGKQTAKKRKKRDLPHAVKTLWYLAKAGRMESLSLQMRIGLVDAAQTALAAGCARALTSALIARIATGAAWSVNILPDFEAAGFAAQARCIFSFQGGDMILAAARAAVKKRGISGKISKRSV